MLSKINLIHQVSKKKKYDNQKIIGLDKAYKDIFALKNLHSSNEINSSNPNNSLERFNENLIISTFSRKTCNFKKRYMGNFGRNIRSSRKTPKW